MIKLNITIDNIEKEYNLSTEWKDVTVGQYEEISKLEMTENKIEYTMKVLSILTEMTIDEINCIETIDFKNIIKHITFIFEPIKTHKKDMVIIDDVEYYFKKDFNSYTIAESINIETLLSETDKMEQIISKVLCVFLRKKVNGDLESFRTSFMNRENIFKRLKVTDVYNLIVFFFDGRKT